MLDLYTAGVPFERIAALQPDLIMAVYTAIELADYDRLAKIAPTVAQPKEFPDYGTPWQQMTRIIGRAVGQPERVDQLVADVEAQLASGERLNLFDTDVLVWWKVNGEGGREKIRANPLYAAAVDGDPATKPPS